MMKGGNRKKKACGTHSTSTSIKVIGQELGKEKSTEVKIMYPCVFTEQGTTTEGGE